MLAQLHIESLAKKPHQKAFCLALENLPERLDSTYDEAMERIENQDVDDFDVAHRVLSWIVYANRPLSVKKIQHALAVEPELTGIDGDALIDEDLLISVFLGLVTVDRGSKVI